MGESADLWAGKEPGDYSGLVELAGPCRLGQLHSDPASNGMVYCEHYVSVFACHHGCTDLPPLDPICHACKKPKAEHTELEAMYCIRRSLAQLSNRPVHVAGAEGRE